MVSSLVTSDMKVGFTGSHLGLSEEQKQVLTRIMQPKPIEVHHGDCIGGDVYFHHVAKNLNLRVVLHPPSNPKSRCFCDADYTHKEKPYLDRNHDIVDDTDILIACPATAKEVLRSGTWATIRYAEKKKKTIIFIYPSGRIFKISEGFGRTK